MITAIVLLGEPKHWETPLQLLVDLLRTNGKPDKPVDIADDDFEQLPVIACNMDLQFMERACIPRFARQRNTANSRLYYISRMLQAVNHWILSLITARNLFSKYFYWLMHSATNLQQFLDIRLNAKSIAIFVSCYVSCWILFHKVV